MENADDLDMVTPFYPYAHKQIYNCVQVLTKTKPVWVPIASYIMSVEQKAPLKNKNEYKRFTKGRQQHTPAHRHNTGGFGTPMLVLLLSIFQHRRRRRAGYRNRTDP